MINGTDIFRACKVLKEAYESDPEFRKAVVDSMLSGIKELKGCHSDRDIAVAAANRFFGDD